MAMYWNVLDVLVRHAPFQSQSLVPGFPRVAGLSLATRQPRSIPLTSTASAAVLLQLLSFDWLTTRKKYEK
jgi:hypothetical protein